MEGGARNFGPVDRLAHHIHSGPGTEPRPAAFESLCDLARKMTRKLIVGGAAVFTGLEADKIPAPMIRIAITAAAFDAIAATLPLGSVGFERDLTTRGERLIWIERLWLNKLDALRGPTESYSDVIFRLAKGEGGEE
jgi:hypothetical protein